MAKLAEGQFGRISRAQLAELGIPNGTVASWLRDGYLHRVLPHVYAVGSRARTTESDLAAALLYAGPGAALSHATAAWWLGLLNDKPRRIQVTTPRKCRSLNSIRVYDRRPRTRTPHRGLPVPGVPEILLDLSATEPLYLLRQALANADYNKVLNLEEIDRALARGARSAAKLRQALSVHRPELALTKSRLERMLIGICEAEGLTLPEVNVKLNGWQIDALWREAKLAVELDGYGNHHTPAQLRRDRRKEMAVRGAGLTPVRYSEEQLEQRTQVAAELRQLICATTP